MVCLAMPALTYASSASACQRTVAHPIDLLYQITKERSIDAHFTDTSPTVESPKKLQHHAPIVPIPNPTKMLKLKKDCWTPSPPVPFSIAGSAVKVSSSPTTHSAAGSLSSSPFVKSRSPSPVLRKAPISSLLPVSSPLRSQEHKTLGKNQSTNLKSPNKPFWAPQETDAPLNLSKKAFNVLNTYKEFQQVVCDLFLLSCRHQFVLFACLLSVLFTISLTFMFLSHSFIAMDMDSKDIICQLCGCLV